MKISEVVLIFLLLLVFGIGAFILLSNYPMQTISFESYSANISADFPLESVQFYPNMRFKDRRISYSVETLCSDKKREDIASALEILSEKTILTFYEDEDNRGITFLCSEIAPEPEQKGHFIAGEGGPTEIINNSVYSVILAAKVSLYRDEVCDEPKIALHEILHAFGFDHNSNKKSIMYPITDCNQELDDYLINDINLIYSVESKPDLAIEGVNAAKNGRYINFNLNITNIGLQDVLDAVLAVSINNEHAKDYDLGVIEIGTKKSLNVENLRGPADSKILGFYIMSKTADGEISLLNNRVDLGIK